jgi:hypothetical protein
MSIQDTYKSLKEQNETVLKKINALQKQHYSNVIIMGALKLEIQYPKFYKCAYVNPNSSMIIKTNIHIDDNGYGKISVFHNMIEFTRYYKDNFLVTFLPNSCRKGILVEYKFNICNEDIFRSENEKYKKITRERGYDIDDTYIYWEIPVEIAFSWFE